MPGLVEKQVPLDPHPHVDRIEGLGRDSVIRPIEFSSGGSEEHGQTI
jgi:hypothetical protein